jgi:hypothetical protein
MSISNYLEDELLDAVFSNGSFAVATCYISLHTADPGETGADECTGGSYARQQAAFDTASGGATANTDQEEFTSMPACTITHVGVWDAVSSGNFLWGGALSASKVVNSGDTVRIAAGDLDVTLD